MKKLLFAFFLVSRVLSENSPEKSENLKRFPRELSCGRVAGGIGLIFGGEKVQKGEYPWMAAMMKKKDRGPPTFFCGGVLISENKILSAAHCFFNKGEPVKMRERDILILLGMHDLENTYEFGRILTAPQEIFIHPRWNPSSIKFDADLAVLELIDIISFNRYISPICLWDSPDDPSPSVGIVVGYGKSEDRNKFHETIPKKLEIPIIDLLKCILKDPLFAQISSPNMICAGAGDGQGACTGDSGGGLFYKQNNKFYLLGIVSASLRGHGGCDVTKPALFTNALKYKGWIENPSSEHQNSGQFSVASPFSTTQRTTRRSSLTPISSKIQEAEIINKNELIVCKNGWQNINFSSMCDGKDDCADRSDEIRCVKGKIEDFTEDGSSSLSTFFPLKNTAINDANFGIASRFDERVKRFFIRENANVKFLPNSLSKKFPKLINVYVRGCSVSKITANNFKGLADLREIHLLDNQIEEIEKGSFDDLRSLGRLELGGNKLRNLDANLFANLINLRILDLNLNQLTTLNENLFRNLGKIEGLYLHVNQISFLPSNVFSNLKQLREINLSLNTLKILPEKLFGNNQKLEGILIEDNEIEKIPSNLFDPLSNIKHIGLEGNTCINEEFGDFWYSGPPLSSPVRAQLKKKLRENC